MSPKCYLTVSCPKTPRASAGGLLLSRALQLLIVTTLSPALSSWSPHAGEEAAEEAPRGPPCSPFAVSRWDSGRITGLRPLLPLHVDHLHFPNVNELNEMKMQNPII